MDYTSVCTFVILGRMEELENALESGINPNYTLGRERFSPLSLAVELRNSRAVKLLMKYGACPNESEREATSLLHEAIELGEITTVETLLRDGEYVDNVLYNGYTPLYLATLKHDLNVMKLLLRYGADPDIGNSDSLTPLHLAVRLRDVSMVDILCAYEASLDIRDRYGCTPLTYAASIGDQRVCRALLQHGANPNDYLGMANITPLCTAAENGYHRVVRLLLDSGADVNAITSIRYRRTPLELVISAIDDYGSESVKMMVSSVILSKYINEGRSASRELFSEGLARNVSIISSIKETREYAVACEEELVTMRSSKIGNKTVYDICLLGENENELAKRIVQLESAAKKTNIYKYLLEKPVKTGIRRARALSSARSTIDRVTSLERSFWNVVPSELKDYILSKLSNEDLVNCIRV